MECSPPLPLPPPWVCINVEVEPQKRGDKTGHGRQEAFGLEELQYFSMSE